MSDLSNTRSGATAASGATEKLRSTAADAMAKVSDVAQQAMGEAKKSASSLASAATDRAKDAVQERISGGAELLGHLASSVRAAARELEPNAPQLAGFANEAAGRIDDFSQDIREKSVEELFETTSEYARRQPAMLFAAAAACGFLLFRLVKTASNAVGETGVRFGEEQYGVAPLPESPPITSGQFHGP
jgi:ElaB/YqjD/DUF883 family membrane-anchored ribosome-binding protein